MDTVFKKLNYKDQNKIFVLNHPDSFNENLKSLSMDVQIKTGIRKTDQIDFFIGFATKQTEIDKMVKKAAPLLNGDAIFWMAYPKKSSKNYTCDFNRDTGWEILGQFEMEGVRMVAIDQDWSAVRFRKVDYIKKMTRTALKPLSKKGAKKVKDKN